MDKRYSGFAFMFESLLKGTERAENHVYQLNM